MFGNKKPPATPQAQAYEAAKEATRRASFLHTAAALPKTDQYKQDLAMLFRVCRASALAAGEAVGQSPAEVDAAIAELCDADITRLKKKDDRAVQAFARESEEITKTYLASVNPEALAAWTQGVTVPRS